MYIEELRKRAAQILNSPEYRVWKNRVLERDKRKCLTCGRRQNKAKGISLEVDHILPFLLHPDKIFDVENGRTLCSQCHRKTATYGNSSEHRSAHSKTIHPFLAGDYLTKIKSLPTSVEIEGQQCGLHIKYKALFKTWVAAYGPQCRVPNISWDTSSYTVDGAIDSLITGLETAAKTLN